LKHHMQLVEHEVRELRRKNAELRRSKRRSESWSRSSPIRRSRSRTRSPPRRRSGSRSRSPPWRRRQHTSSDDMRSSSEEEDKGQIRKMARRYKKRKGWDESFPIDGHTSFPN
ncbi:hypothetical protein PIB30_094714, partial [Stylosanthes scabra]|nr:hypothetical protein [Stylosanthes scabra]